MHSPSSPHPLETNTYIQHADLNKPVFFTFFKKKQQLGWNECCNSEMAENNVIKHLSKLLHCRVGEFCVRFGRFWGYLLFLDPNCCFLLVLIVCQLLEQLTLQLQLKLP
jgi:hypothetical protein